MKKFLNRGHFAARNTRVAAMCPLTLLIFIVLIAMAGVSYYAMYQVGDRIINEAIDQQLSQLDQQLDNAGNDPSVILSEAKNLTTQPEQPAANNPSVILSEAKNPTTNPQIQPAANDASVILSEAKNPTTQPQQSATNDPNVILSEAKNLTRSQLENAKDKINASDKVSIANLVLKKLSSQDISELTNMISGGLTTEEKKRAKDIAYKRFTQDEITTIIQLYEKYMQ